MDIQNPFAVGNGMGPQPSMQFNYPPPPPPPPPRNLTLMGRSAATGQAPASPGAPACRVSWPPSRRC